MTISFEDWLEEYKPIFIEEDEFKDFDFYREELKAYANNRIWTEVDCGNELIYILPGLHIVNKSRIFVTEAPWEDEDLDVDCNEHITLEKAISAALEFGESINVLLYEEPIRDWYLSIFDGYDAIPVGTAKYRLQDYFNDELGVEFTQEQEDSFDNFYSTL
jgi:hypothetical protein